MVIARGFAKRGLLLAVGNEPDYKIMWKAGEWFRMGILLEEDLADVQAAIDGNNQSKTETEE